MSEDGVDVAAPRAGGDAGRPTGDAAGTTAVRESTPSLVDPRAPRFGQTLTATGLLLGVALGEPLFVLGVAAVLTTAVLSGWRLDLWGALWKRVAGPVLGRPATREPAAPHRFAKLVGAGFTTLASVLLLAAPVAGLPDLAVAGFAVAAFVAALAGVAAVTDVCIGCRLYRQVSFFRRIGVV